MSESTQQAPKPLIWTDKNRLGGIPCFMGTRVPVQSMFDYLEAGEPLDEFLEDFPNVSREHAIAVMMGAQSALLDEAA